MNAQAKDAFDELRAFIKENEAGFQALSDDLEQVRETRGRPSPAKRYIGALARQQPEPKRGEAGRRSVNLGKIRDLPGSEAAAAREAIAVFFPDGKHVADKRGLGVYIQEARRLKDLL